MTFFQKRTVLYIFPIVQKTDLKLFFMKKTIKILTFFLKHSAQYRYNTLDLSILISLITVIIFAVIQISISVSFIVRDGEQLKNFRTNFYYTISFIFFFQILNCFCSKYSSIILYNELKMKDLLFGNTCTEAKANSICISKEKKQKFLRNTFIKIWSYMVKSGIVVIRIIEISTGC